MKKAGKILAVLFAVLMVVSLAACGETKTPITREEAIEIAKTEGDLKLDPSEPGTVITEYIYGTEKAEQTASGEWEVEIQGYVKGVYSLIQGEKTVCWFSYYATISQYGEVLRLKVEKD